MRVVGHQRPGGERIEKPALSMKCGACGASNDIDLPGVQAVARSEAEKLTDAAVAERYRAAFRLMVRGAMPEKLQRLPLALVDRMSDDAAILVGRDVLTVMLAPT